MSPVEYQTVKNSAPPFGAGSVPRCGHPFSAGSFPMIAASGASHLRGGEVGQPVGIGPSLARVLDALLMLPIIAIS